MRIFQPAPHYGIAAWVPALGRAPGDGVCPGMPKPRLPPLLLCPAMCVPLLVPCPLCPLPGTCWLLQCGGVESAASPVKDTWLWWRHMGRGQQACDVGRAPRCLGTGAGEHIYA